MRKSVRGGEGGRQVGKHENRKKMGGKTWEKLRSNLGETGEKPEGEKNQRKDNNWGRMAIKNR